MRTGAGVLMAVAIAAVVILAAPAISASAAADEPRVEILIVPSIDHTTAFPAIRMRVAVSVSEGRPCVDDDVGIVSVWVRVRGVAREAIPVDDGLYEVTITLRSQQVGETIITVEVITDDGERIEDVVSLALQSPGGPEPGPDPDPVPVQEQESVWAWEALAMLSLLVGVISITAVALVALGVLG